MPELTFWEVVGLVAWLALVQMGTRFLIDWVSGRLRRRRDNVVYDLYINDTFNGKHILKECREIYEGTNYKTMKGASHARRTKRFDIHVDSR